MRNLKVRKDFLPQKIALPAAPPPSPIPQKSNGPYLMQDGVRNREKIY